MWMDWEYFKADASQYLIQIRTLIKQLKEYGVDEDTLFHVDDLLYSNNIPKVARCLKQVAIIVSINKDNGQKAWPRQIPRYWHMSAAIYVVLSRTKLITTLAINFLNSGSKWCSEKLIAKRIFWEVIGCEIRVRHGETECWIKSLLSRVMPSFVCHVTGVIKTTQDHCHCPSPRSPHTRVATSFVDNIRHSSQMRPRSGKPETEGRNSDSLQLFHSDVHPRQSEESFIFNFCERSLNIQGGAILPSGLHTSDVLM